MKFLIHFFIAFACLSVSVSSHSAMVDQNNDETTNSSLNGQHSILNWQQQVTAGLEGQLSSIDLYFQTPGNIQFYINLGAGWQPDANDYTADLFMLTGWNTIDVTAANIVLNPGDQFVIGIQGLGQPGESPNFWGSNSNPYLPGTLFLNGYEYSGGQVDMNFRTLVNPVPVPAAVWLLGSAMLGLIGFKRKA